VVASGAEEAEQGRADEIALTNARRKARQVAGRLPERRVLGVDTVVTLDGRLYGKPADRDDAARALRALAGREHRVVGGICLIDPLAGERVAVAVTSVSFRTLDEALLEWYLDSGEWNGRAGSYAIQGRGAALVAAIDGDYLNVVGLPLNALLQLEPDVLQGPQS
jgi:septum formation protein